MEVSKVLTDERAVSPVIGVILMVAITVILAAVIGAFVLGFGGQQDTPPQASFEFEGSSGSTFTISHDGGQTVTTDLSVGYKNTSSDDVTETWSADISAGDTHKTDDSVAANSTIRVIWNSPSSDSSQILAEHSVA